MSKIRICLVALLGLILVAGTSAQAPSPAKPAAKSGTVTAPAHSATPAKSAAKLIPIQPYKLKNGLHVVLSPDNSAPTYAINVTYNVGSRDERVGRTGFAHLFEHMMFQGSENIGKGEHMILVANNGGSMNGSTNQDRTNYFEALPSNQLDLGLFLESDRMKSLAITQANLDNQRNAVQEERRLNYDNRPYGKTYEVLLETAYDNFAYKHDTIGSMKDLDAASLGDVQQFFKTYYAPNNAVLTLVGDFDPKVAMAKIEKYFGSIPSQPAAKPVDMAEPKQTAERRVTIEDNFAQLPRLDIAFKTVPGNTPDWYATEVMMRILGGGQSSRLYQKLVKDTELAVNVGAFQMQSRGTSLATISVTARPGKNLADIEKAVYEELDRLQTEPVSASELQKTMMQMRARSIQQKQSTLGRANQIGIYAVYFGDPNLINTQEARYAAVTPAQVQAVAKKFFAPTERTVLTTLPKSAAAHAAKSGM
jgi:zinc protease